MHKLLGTNMRLLRQSLILNINEINLSQHNLILLSIDWALLLSRDWAYADKYVFYFEKVAVVRLQVQLVPRPVAWSKV